MNNIASAYNNKGEYENALEKYKECLEIRTKVLGAGSIQVAGTLNNIASVYDNKGEYEKALENYNKCLEIETKAIAFVGT